MVRAPGEQFGDYRLVRLLGEGGFAEVYEAEHVHLSGVKAAIKLLKGSFTPQQIEELRREALMVSKLNHPHIVQLRTFSIERNTAYLVMAYAPGGTLSQKFPRGTCVAWPEILAHVRPVAAALQYVHEQHIVHRDLKPANLLLTQDGQVQVADFGIAVVAHTSNSKTIQEIAGTWVYTAPEQFRGRAEPASDQYSLAIMVYQWLCGEPPFTGNGSIYALPYQHMSEPPPSLCERISTLSPRIERVVMKALAKLPGERFASVSAFTQAFEEACTKPSPGTTLLTYKPPEKYVRAIAWSSDGRLLATGSKKVQVWDAGTGKCLRQYEEVSSLHEASSLFVEVVGWSPDGRLLATGEFLDRMQMWEVVSGKVLWQHEGDLYYLTSAAWSPDGRLLAWGWDYGSVDVWEVASGKLGKLLREYEGHTYVQAVAWSPDGRLLASGSADNTVQAWEAASGKLLRQYEGHTGEVQAVAWSPDGRLLASGSADNTVQVWEASTGKVLLTYHGHLTSVSAVAWSPDGERIASAGDEVRVWVAPY